MWHFLNMNNTIGPVLGLLGIVLTLGSLVLGDTQSDDTKKMLFIGLGLIVAGIVIGNGLLSG